MERKRLVDLIRKQRSGGLTREEEDELESYWVLAQNDQSRFDALTQAEKEALRLSMMANIKARIHADRGVRRSLSHSLNNRSLWLSLAACITIAVAAFIYWPDAGNPEMNIYRTAYGEQLRLRLPDQSNVIVNGNSSVKFTTQWQNEGARSFGN